VLLQGLAVVGAITQLGFNWFSFFRAHGDTRPPAVGAAVEAIAFLLLAITGLLVDGFDGFVYGRIGAALIALVVRGIYTRRLLPSARYRDLVIPSLFSIVLASAVVLAVRLALWGGHRSLAQAILELALFVAVYTATALRRERSLMFELLGALRGSREGAVGQAR
jgi:hypothetical protein